MIWVYFTPKISPYSSCSWIQGAIRSVLQICQYQYTQHFQSSRWLLVHFYAIIHLYDCRDLNSTLLFKTYMTLFVVDYVFRFPIEHPAMKLC